MPLLKFDGMQVEVSKEELERGVMDIPFGRAIKVQFTKQEDGIWIPTNAMDGWGDNCFQEVVGKEVIIEN